MKYFSMFTGIGGFELGIQQAYGNNQDRKQEPIRKRSIGGSIQRQRNIPDNRSRWRKSQSEERYRLEQWLCVGYSEIDKYAIQIYERHFNHKNYGDATKIDPKELPDFDLLVGGFPCQAFSIAGKRRGFDDTRGTLFFDIARITAEKRPRHLILENVKGLLSHDDGNTFKTIISSLAELGYGVEWQVLNSKNFGVPQNRERVFIIGHLGGCCGRQVFPIRSDNPEADGKTASNTIDSNYWKGIDNHGQRTMIELTQNVSDAQRIYDAEGIAKTLKGLGGGLGAKTGLYKTKSSRIRRLTPVECERLQGFPDNWTAGESDTQRYKTLGNGVTVNVVREVVKRLFQKDENL